MTAPGRLLVYPDPEALAAGAAALFRDQAREAVQARGRFLVVLAGGTTPRRTYARLAAPPFREEVPWEKVEFFWGDERAVPLDHPDSNYHMAREALLDHIPVAAGQVHPMAAYPSVAHGAAAYEALLRRHCGGEAPVFDLIFLGLGADGHTASLFPGHPALKEWRRWVVPVTLPEGGLPRITLTLPIINQARIIAFLVSGAEKAEIFAKILQKGPAAAALPASRVRPEHGTLLWLADAATAGGGA